MISVPVRSDVFVERAEEMAFLHARLTDAGEKRGSFVILRGEAGSGKSRLLDEFVTRHASALRVARVRCSPAMREPRAVLGALCEALAGAVGRDAPSALEPDRAIAFVRGILLVARSGAIVLGVEDVQHAASTVLDALEHIGGIGRALVVISLDEEEVPADVGEAIARIRARGAYDLRLGPLPVHAMRRMIRRFHWGSEAPPRELVQRVVALAKGNPGLAEDLVRSIAEGGRLGETPVPHAARFRARRMLDRLDAATRRLILIAAIAGVEFDVDALAHIAEQPARAVLEALQLAALAGLVRETAPRRFAFTHPIVRLALRAELAPSFARPYHRRAAQLWERDAASVAACEAVAEHWRDADEAEQARAWDERAGDAAVEGEDFARAAAAYRRAESDRPDEATRRRLLLKAANALRRAGLEHEALLAFDDYFACGPVAEDGRPAQALLEKMQLSWGAGDVAAVDALAEEILGLDLPQIDPIKAHTLVRLAGMRWVAGRHAEAQECIDRVEREYPLVDPEILGEFHQQRGLLAYGTGRFDDAIEELRRGLRYIERSGNAALHAQQLCNFGNVALVHARNDLALELLERAVALTGVIASESKRAFVYASYARALMQVGRLREAREALRALESADADIAELHVPYTVVPMLELGSMLDDDALIERALEGDPLEQAFASGEPQRILPLATAFAAYQWYRGGRETARELLHRALVANGSGSWHYGFALLVAKIGSLRDVPRARRMLEPARATGEPAVIAAFGDLFDAFVERRRGRNAAAVTCGRRAARAFAGFGWPCFEAQAHQAAGDPAAALRTYERIGDVRDAKELRAAPRPARRAPGHVALTAREREVGLLAVDGLSNPEIAGRLGIGVRTVEHHLQALYGKLGIRSRWQLPSEF